MSAIRIVRFSAASTTASIRHSTVATTAVLAFALTFASGCVRSEARADARDGAQSDAAAAAPVRGGGTIEGRILHPAHVVPAMRICAIGSGAPQEAKRVCVRTQPHQDRYRIEALPADDYIVIAQAESNAPLHRVGGHMQQVQCIRAPCPEMPASVSVGTNARVDGIDINHFYDKRDDFPVLGPE
jgi:hypothetical protein